MLRGGGPAALFLLGTACGPAFDPADAVLAAGFDPQDALHPELAAAARAISCDHGDRTLEHTAAEALALHVDPPR